MNKYHLNFILYLGDSLMPARICKCYGQKLLWLENYFIFTSLCLRFYLAADKEVNKVKARFFLFVVSCWIHERKPRKVIHIWRQDQFLLCSLTF